MADKYSPQHGTVRDFEELHPKGGDTVVQVDDIVKIPGNETRWIVTGFSGDFAKLQEAHGRKTFAFRRTQLERIDG
ncbi:hypothetical protein GS534_24430 [Rhodococcus hoagii]|nr:hypothetical protein [Prescottella equi]MBM4617923.1 hypothetical protein [Prescottella equi]NKS33177.1 hypothetical protein [Prescottella equi]